MVEGVAAEPVPGMPGGFAAAGVGVTGELVVFDAGAGWAGDAERGTMAGFAGAPGTLVGSLGELGAGFSSTLMVGLAVETAGVDSWGLGFGLAGGKRKSGTFPRFDSITGSLFFETGVGGGVAFAATLGGSFAAGVG